MAFILEEQVKNIAKQVAPQRKFTLDSEIGEPPFEQGETTVSNVFKQIPGGARDAVVELGQTVGSFADFLRDTFPEIKKLDPGTQFSIPVPEIEPPTSGTASFVRGTTQFLTAFLPLFNATKGLGAVKGGLAAGAIADLAAFDPNDPTLTDTLINIEPRLRNPLTELLATSPDDPESFKRFQRAVEGLGLGAISEGVLRFGKLLITGKKAKLIAQTPTQEAVVEAAPRAVRESILKPEGPRFVLEDTAQTIPEAPQLPIDRSPSGDLPKFAGSVNLERLNTEDDVKEAILEASKVISKSEPVSDQEIIDAAATMGFDLNDAEALARTTTDQRAQFLASRQVGTALAERYEQARKIFKVSPTPENFDTLRINEALFLKAFQSQQQLARVAGQTLRSFQIGSKALVGESIDREINKLLTILNTKGALSDEVTARLAGLDKGNPEEVNTFMQFLAAKAAKISDKIYEAYLASILSGPQTHAANVSGNLANAAIRPVERAGAATIDLFAAPFRAGGRERFFLEAPLDIHGMFAAIPDAARAFLRTAKSGMTTFGAKLEIPARSPAIEGIKGSVIRSPLRLLLATDEFFKALSRGGDLYVKAYRDGVVKGKKGQELFDHIQALRQNPTPEIINSIDEEAAYRTFTKHLNAPGKAILAVRDNVPGARYIFPFVTTPINIAKFGLERTPLKAFDLIRMAAKGELPKGGGSSEEFNKLAMGVALTWWVASEVASGNITDNGPTNPEDLRALRGSGWAPLSIKTGDEYVSYSRIEPFATSIGIIADATTVTQSALEADVIDEKTAADLVNKTVGIVVQNVTEKTFLQGLGDLSDALHDPERYGERFIQGRTRAIVPSIIGQAATAQDVELRQVRSQIDSIKSRLPKIGDFEGRQGLFPIRDIVGEPIEQVGNFWYRYLVPLRRTKLEASPAATKIAEVGARIGKLPRQVTVKGTNIDLDDAQYDRYQVLAGEFVKKQLNPLVGSLGSLPKETQATQIQDAVTRGRAIGRKIFIGELAREGKLTPALTR